MVKKRKAEDPLADGTIHESPVPFNGEDPESKSTRRKKPTQARTLRACDRCQHRKLACDGALECCQQCQKANTWCTMTDPVTGTAYYRGQFDYLEKRVDKQKNEIKDLLARLRAVGQDMTGFDTSDRDTERYEAWASVKAVDETKPWEREERHPKEEPQEDGLDHKAKPDDSASTSGGGRARKDSDLSSRPPSSKQAVFPARNFVGVSTHSKFSKTQPGSRLNILGWELDIANFTEEDDEFEELPDPEHPIYDRSYRSFIATAHGLQPRLRNVKLPSRQQAFNYALQQLHTVGAFVPILHKPSLTELLTRFYDDRDFYPSVGQEVCIHMSFAISYYQSAARNFQNKDFDGFHELSNQHYHYALGFWPQLMIGNTLEDMQAMAMISAHTRTFPKPEVGWIAFSATFNRLIQLDYHRSASSEQSWVAQKSFLELEMRKRVFWSVLVLGASANGKLGRPMPMRWEDFDVEFPLAVNDEQLTPTGRDESQKGPCHFLPAIESFRIEPIFADLYNTLYALRKLPQNPERFLEKAESRLQDWWDTRHPDLSEDSSNPLMRVLSQSLRSWTMEYRILLYHPSLSLSESPSFNEMHLRKCMEAAKGLLGIVTVLKNYKTMDTTWYTCAMYILAIQTTLYGYHQFRNELTSEKLKALREDMSSWLSIIGDVGWMLGSGTKLKQTIKRQIEEGLASLEQHFRQKISASKMKREPSEPMTAPRRRSSVLQRSESEVSVPHLNGFQQVSSENQTRTYPSENGHEHSVIVDSDQSLPISHYAYGHPEQPRFDHSVGTAYPASQVVALVSQPGSHASYDEHHSRPAEASNVGQMYIANNVTDDHGYPTLQVYGGETMSWYQYTQMLGAGGMGPQDYQPATALLQLGGHSENSGSFQSVTAHGPYEGEHVAVTSSQAWPYVILDPQPEQQ